MSMLVKLLMQSSSLNNEEKYILALAKTGSGVLSLAKR